MKLNGHLMLQFVQHKVNDGTEKEDCTNIKSITTVIHFQNGT